MNNFIRLAVSFVKSNEVLLELLLYIAKRLFGADVVDEAIAFVKEASLQLKSGREKFEQVRAKLENSVTAASSAVKDQKFWLNLLIEIVVAYLKTTKRIQ